MRSNLKFLSEKTSMVAFVAIAFLGTSLSYGARLSAQLRIQIADAARRSTLDPRLVEAVIQVESNFDPAATSPKGAMGLMQVIPPTADRCGIHNPYHEVNNLMGACECLRNLINRFQGDLKLALAAYNAGEANVIRHRGIPPFPETKRYVKKVISIYQKLKRKS